VFDVAEGGHDLASRSAHKASKVALASVTIASAALGLAPGLFVQWTMLPTLLAALFVGSMLFG